MAEVLGSTAPDFDLITCQYKRRNILSDKTLVKYDRHLLIKKLTRFLEREGNFCARGRVFEGLGLLLKVFHGF